MNYIRAQPVPLVTHTYIPFRIEVLKIVTRAGIILEARSELPTRSSTLLADGHVNGTTFLQTI